MSEQVTTVMHGTIAPEQIRHTLGDDGWSSLDLGPLRIQIPAGDLTRVRGARDLAKRLAAEVAFWASDLAAIEERLVQAERSATQQPESAEAALGDEPYGGADPALDAQVTRVAEMPETHRKPRTPKSPKEES